MTKSAAPQVKPGSRALGRPKAEEGRDTRGDLLRVARELFAARGYVGTSVTDVGARAEVTVPVIYQRFGNKAGLFVAVAEDVYTRGLAQLRDAVGASAGFDTAVDAVLAEFATIHQVDPTLAAMVVTVLVEAERDDELGAALQPSLRRFRRFVGDIASRAPAELASDADGRRDLARALVALFSGIMISATLLPRPNDYEAMVGAMRRMVLGHPTVTDQA